MLRIEQWSKQIVPVLLGSTSQWGRHFKKDKEKGREQTCYLGCSGQGRPLCVHGFLHRDLNELRGVSQRGIWRWDLLKWHMLSCRSWPWPLSDVPYASTVPLYSNLTEYLLLFTEFCVSISGFYSSSSHFLLLEYSPTQIFWVMSSCDSFLWMEMPLNAQKTQSKQFSGLFSCLEGWMSNGAMMWVTKGLLLLLIYRSYMQVSTCFLSVTDLTSVEEMPCLNLTISKSRVKHITPLCQDIWFTYSCVFMSLCWFLCWKGMIYEKTNLFLIYQSSAQFHAISHNLYGPVTLKFII